MTKAFLFDVDGTLVDSVDFHARSWQEAFRHFGKDVSFEAVRAQIGKGGDQLLPVFLSGDELERLGPRVAEYKAQLFRREYQPRVRPFPKVRELFARIKADGLLIALASSSKADEVEHYKQLLQVADLVDAATSAADADRTKPHPDIFAAALEQLGGAAPGEAVVFGDSPYDAEAAAKLNIPVIGLLCGGFPERDLRAAGCAAIYRDPEDLLRDYTALAELAPRRAA
jgi:HAD superfamily hydrolase (TIGR01509 family)